MKTTTIKTRTIVTINGIDYIKQGNIFTLHYPVRTFDRFHTYSSKN
jgi:hypothetical protein